MLETTWFVIWGLLWAIYFMLDGFDLGVGCLFPFLARDDAQRRILYRTIEPVWDGNEVWLITAGGVTFAAFPGTYAVLFSTLYTPLMLILFGLIIRGAAIPLRAEMESARAKRLWDVCFIATSFLVALLLGVAFANLFRGLPIDAKGLLQGNLLTLLNPYGLLGGVLFVVAFAFHGALWIARKTEGDLSERAGALARRLWWAVLVVAVVFLVATAFATDLYANYLAVPALWLVPLGAVAALVLAGLLARRGAWLGAWGASAATIVCVALFGVLGMYPALLPSSLDPAFSMTTANTASSPLTLKIMLTVALIFVPVVIAYQVWVFVMFGHRIGEAELEEEGGY